MLFAAITWQQCSPQTTDLLPASVGLLRCPSCISCLKKQTEPGWRFSQRNKRGPTWPSIESNTKSWWQGTYPKETRISCNLCQPAGRAGTSGLSRSYLLHFGANHFLNSGPPPRKGHLGPWRPCVLSAARVRNKPAPGNTRYCAAFSWSLERSASSTVPVSSIPSIFWNARTPSSSDIPSPRHPTFSNR